MGLFKKIRKAVSKAIKKPLSAVAGLAGLADVPKAPDAPDPAAVVVDTPKEEAKEEDGAQTESGKKKTKSGGKKSLSVARSSGGGINI